MSHKAELNRAFPAGAHLPMPLGDLLQALIDNVNAGGGGADLLAEFNLSLTDLAAVRTQVLALVADIAAHRTTINAIITAAATNLAAVAAVTPAGAGSAVNPAAIVADTVGSIGGAGIPSLDP